MALQMLILKPDESRDFYILSLKRDGKHIGRIFKSNSSPPDVPWFWTIDFFSRRSDEQQQGYAPTREDAMKAFRAAWDSLPSP